MVILQNTPSWWNFRIQIRATLYSNAYFHAVVLLQHKYYKILELRTLKPSPDTQYQKYYNSPNAIPKRKALFFIIPFFVFLILFSKITCLKHKNSNSLASICLYIKYKIKSINFYQFNQWFYFKIQDAIHKIDVRNRWGV